MALADDDGVLGLVFEFEDDLELLPTFERTRATDWWGGEINKDTKRPRTLAHCAMLAYTEKNKRGSWGPFFSWNDPVPASPA